MKKMNSFLRKKFVRGVNLQQSFKKVRIDTEKSLNTHQTDHASVLAGAQFGLNPNRLSSVTGMSSRTSLNIDTAAIKKEKI